MRILSICLLKEMAGERQTVAHVEFCSEGFVSVRSRAYTDKLF